MQQLFASCLAKLKNSVREKIYLNPFDNLVKSQIQVLLFLPQRHDVLPVGNTPFPLESTHSMFQPKHKFCFFCEAFLVFFPTEAFSLFISHGNCSYVNYYIYDLLYNEFITCASLPHYQYIAPSSFQKTPIMILDFQQVLKEC